ncbi:MAG: apolipoprotein N-acyltransferase, partial [Xenococcus sp. (in: cyanobacteria)]
MLASLWAVGYHGLALFWLTGLHPMTWMGVPWLVSLFIALFCWIFVTLWGVALVSLWSILFVYLTRKITIKSDKEINIKILGNVLLGVTLWCCGETLWSYGD